MLAAIALESTLLQDISMLSFLQSHSTSTREKYFLKQIRKMSGLAPGRF